jgi:hypothetical protein
MSIAQSTGDSKRAPGSFLYLLAGCVDLFSPGTYSLSTAILPDLRRLVNLPFGRKTPFPAEVYLTSMFAA